MRVQMTMVHSEEISVQPKGGMTIGKFIDNRLLDILHDHDTQLRSVTVTISEEEHAALRILSESGAVR